MSPLTSVVFTVFCDRRETSACDQQEDTRSVTSLRQREPPLEQGWGLVAEEGEGQVAKAHAGQYFQEEKRED